MKNLKYIIIAVSLGLVPMVTSAQCTESNVRDACGNKLKSGFTYLKTYDVDGEGEYSYVFSKGNTYLIQNCPSSGLSENMKITIYDRTKRRLASNYDSKSGEMNNPFLGYLCKMTSIYYVKFEIDEDADEECGVGILGFK